MTTSIAQLEQQYEDFSANARDIGKGIANSVSMMQLDAVQESIASAVIEIEAVTNKTNKKSFFEAIPGLGKFIASAKKDKDAEDLRTGNMIEVVDRLFNSLKAKKDNIETVASSLFDLKEKLIDQIASLEVQENEVKLIAYEDGRDSFKAKNLLVQITPTLSKAIDRVDVIEVTIKSAQVSAQKISAMLPALHGDLITEMSIQAGLQELKDFKQVFDATVDVIEELSATNNQTMGEVLRDVADLAVNRPTDKALARIENTNSQRIKLAEDIRNKMSLAVKQRDKSLIIMTEARQAQTHNLLSNSTGPK